MRDAQLAAEHALREIAAQVLRVLGEQRPVRRGVVRRRAGLVVHQWSPFAAPHALA
jgi:hypothetical protein